MTVILTIIYIIISLFLLFFLYKIEVYIIWIILILIGLIVGYLVYSKIRKNKPSQEIYKSNIKNAGICYFDIDDTLTSAKGDPSGIIQECFDNGYDVGVITAGSRTIDDICIKEKGLYKWMPDNLCKRLRENPTLFNSRIVVAGDEKFPSDYPINHENARDYGYIKGFNMAYGKRLNYPSLDDKHIILFDDDINVLNGVKRYNKSFEVQCSNTKCNGKYLSRELVKEKLKNMR